MPKPVILPDPPSSQSGSIPAGQGKIFYGWWIALGGMLIMTLSSGIGFFGHALILDPMRATFGWSKGTISSAVTLFFLVSAFCGTMIGEKTDRYGPTPIFVFGATCTGLGFVLLSRIHELWQLYAVYFLLGVGWSGTGTVPVSALVANWFVRKRGLAMSVAMTGLSLGGVLIVPAASLLLRRLGFKDALPVFGLAYWLIILPIALFVVKRRPEVMGLHPDGDRSSPSGEGGLPPLDLSPQTVRWTRRQAMATRSFWAIVLAFFMVQCGQVAFMIHEISFLTPHLGTAGAATAVGLTSGASLIGRLLAGSLVDRLDKRIFTMICLIIQGGALFVACHSNHVATLYLSVILFGLTMGNIVMMQSLIIGECFGMVSFGTIAGLAMLFTSFGSALGPGVAGVLFDLTEGYKVSFTLFSSAYLLAAIVVLAASPPSPQVPLARKGH